MCKNTAAEPHCHRTTAAVIRQILQILQVDDSQWLTSEQKSDLETQAELIRDWKYYR